MVSLVSYEGGAEISTEEFRPIKSDFAARILIQLIILKLFKFKHEISVHMKTTFDSNYISKIWHKIEFFGFENRTHKISEQSTLR